MEKMNITSCRRVNRESNNINNKDRDKKRNIWKDVNHNSKNSEITNTAISSSKKNNNSNNINNNNNISDSPYSSLSMVSVKKNSENKIQEKNTKYDNSTYKNKKKRM